MPITSRHGECPSTVATSGSLPQRRDGQGHGKGRPLALAWACGRDVPPVHLHEFAHDRQAEPQTSMGASHRAISLAESLEDDRQYFGANADAGVSDANHDLRPHALDQRCPPGHASARTSRHSSEDSRTLAAAALDPRGLDPSSRQTCLNLEVLLESRPVGTESSAVETLSTTLTDCMFSRSRPPRMLDRSRRSSINRACWLAFRTMVSRARSTMAASFRAPPRICAHPKIEFRGVRSSWDRVARKSSLARFAASASVRASCSRANSCS